MRSNLQKKPKSKILTPGYINIYSNLNSSEKRQIEYKSEYKSKNPAWDESQVLLTQEFAHLFNNRDDLLVLDAGCGNGNYLVDEQRGKIAWAVGIDLDQACVKKNVCLDEIAIGSLEKLPFENDSFDAVVSLWVLEHLKNPSQVFNEIHRVLKRDGVFLFATPNKSFLPLVFIRILKSKAINKLVNKVAFGRKAEDIFPSYYKANTVKDIQKLYPDLFDAKILKYNYDPSYTSFNGITFKLSNLVHSLISRLGFKFTYAHIVGVLRKT